MKPTKTEKRTAPTRNAPRVAKVPPVRPRHAEHEDHGGATGSYFFPLVPWNTVKRLELYRVMPTTDGGEGFIGCPRVTVNRWDDEYAVGLKAGGSGIGVWQVRLRTLKGTIGGSVSFPVDGEPSTGTDGRGVVTANETSLGIVTIPGAEPMVNLIFTLLQQQLAQERVRADQQVGTIERLFVAVCTTGKNNQDETTKAIMEMLMGEVRSNRSKVGTLLDENATLKQGTNKHASAKDIVEVLVQQGFQHGPSLLDAIKRLLDGRPPAELEAGLASAAVAAAT